MVPGRVEVEQAGVGRVDARKAADVLRLKPTRQYGRSFRVASAEVAIPGLLLPEYRREAWRGDPAPIPRPLSSDIGVLAAVLMRGAAPRRWAEWDVMALAYNIPPCNPLAQFEPLRPKVDALYGFARRFNRANRLPLFAAELHGDEVHDERGWFRGHLSASVAAVATRDPADLAALAFEARVHLD